MRIYPGYLLTLLVFAPLAFASQLPPAQSESRQPVAASRTGDPEQGAVVEPNAKSGLPRKSMFIYIDNEASVDVPDTIDSPSRGDRSISLGIGDDWHPQVIVCHRRQCDEQPR